MKYIHCEILKFSRSNAIIFKSVKYSIDSVLIEVFINLIGHLRQALKFDLLLYFSKAFFIDLEKDAIKSKEWRDLWINLIDESQSDYKDHRWFQNGCNRYVNCLGSQKL